VFAPTAVLTEVELVDDPRRWVRCRARLVVFADGRTKSDQICGPDRGITI
jgi:hypothetical protein